MENAKQKHNVSKNTTLQKTHQKEKYNGSENTLTSHEREQNFTKYNKQKTQSSSENKAKRKLLMLFF